MGKLTELKKDLKKLINPGQARLLARFFKTGKGEYGEGDIFLGIKVPEQRKIALKYLGLNFADLRDLLADKIHDRRMVALLILTYRYPKASEKDKKKIYNFYLKNKKAVNNWDLTDVTCHKIVGEYLLERDRKILYELANSKELWDRRIAIVSTAAFIRVNDFKDTLKISKILLNDEHDLIHKAVGWMLREVGKKDKKELIKFLDRYYKKMPRTMLRYAIEKLPQEERRFYLEQ